MFNTIPILQVREGTYVVYDEPIHRRKYANNVLNRRRMLRAQRKQYSGSMTAGARKRMTRAITILSQACPSRTIYNEITGRYQHHRLTFITLTISCRKIINTEDAYQNLLRPFLAWLRDTKGVTTNIWKLEFQERGQPHYHITIPNFIHYAEVKKKWNSLQHAAGYLSEYAAQHGHFNPNSTDVHSVNKRNFANYLVKELCKTVDGKRLKAKTIVDSLVKAGEIPADQAEKFIEDYAGVELRAMGKVWGCSENLAGVSYFAIPLERWHVEQIELLKRNDHMIEKSGDFWSILYVKSNSPPVDILNDQERKNLDDYLQTILKNSEPVALSDTETKNLFIDENNGTDAAICGNEFEGYRPFATPFQGDLF